MKGLFVKSRLSLLGLICVITLIIVPTMAGAQGQPSTSPKQGPAPGPQKEVTPPSPPKNTPPAGQVKTDTPGEAPKMTFETNHIDFGTVDEGATVTKAFTVKNTGKGELKIEKVSPS
ncbi:MAG: DUF1573 domain-containing protein [Deltaproteobacteria bacterium]|nr:DUF1573 domain-containing protein [Deltaproteobacteria bacterium]MBF0525459.1 DUF1573 domain-containing protein [Deltaproteobacteria bacterium]